MLRPCLVAVAAILTASGCAGDGAPFNGTGGGPGSAGNGSGTAGSGSGTAGSGSGTAGDSGTAGSGSGTAGDSGTAGSGQTGTGGTGPTVTPPKQALTPPQACTSSAPGPRKLWRLTGPQFTASIRAIFNDTAAAAPVAHGVQRPVQPRLRDRRQCPARAGAERVPAAGQRRGDRGLGGDGEQAVAVRDLHDQGHHLRHHLHPRLRPARLPRHAGGVRSAHRHLPHGVHGRQLVLRRGAGRDLGDAAVAPFPLPERARDRGRAAPTR